MRKLKPALAMYVRAVELDPRANLALMRKATIFLKLGDPLEALKDLEYLKDIAPDDPNVHFMLGKAHKMARNKASALRHYTIALHLDPKAQSWIKEQME